MRAGVARSRGASAELGRPDQRRDEAHRRPERIGRTNAAASAPSPRDPGGRDAASPANRQPDPRDCLLHRAKASVGTAIARRAGAIRRRHGRAVKKRAKGVRRRGRGAPAGVRGQRESISQPVGFCSCTDHDRCYRLITMSAVRNSFPFGVAENCHGIARPLAHRPSRTDHMRNPATLENQFAAASRPVRNGTCREVWQAGCAQWARQCPHVTQRRRGTT